MRVLLVDDEKMALEVLERQLMQIEGIQITGKYTDPGKALDKFRAEGADIVFLDLELGGMHGLSLAQEMLNASEAPEVIFVTAYSQYAVDAYEMDAIDYLLKPVTVQRLQKAIQKVEERRKIKSIRKEQRKTQKPEICIRSFGTFQVYIGKESAPMRWRTKKVKEMFCFLWMNKEQPVNKYRIMEELWPEAALDKGTALLHTTVYQLRKAMKELGFGDGLQYMNDQYVLTMPIKSDLEELKQLLEENSPGPEEMKRILSLYEGDLLEQDEYGWCNYERQLIKNSYLNCLQKYIEKNPYKSQNDILESCLLKLFRMDVYSERHVMLLMDYYAGIGNTKALIETYEYYSSILREELGLMPSRRIVELYRRYLKRE